jgi:YD repeat-containing protein
MDSALADWERLSRPGFALELSYPTVTPQGQAVERTEEEVDDHRGHMERVHLSSPDRRELYVEVARFHGCGPEQEYLNHSPYLRERFGADAVTGLTHTSLQERQAWTYAFTWDEEGRRRERAALLVPVSGDTYRIIYDPRSELNERVLATVTFAD